ncbi:DUF317 domain-containing protein [Streptomyces hesseae]|uniref:DUF317 domain-containing protein n=1 Tax=Streptomyces hesseae TaxID=3075519 RepID=A0ABU2SJL1_9ACTN|nr:DUF317 domain-containing protein [Streptomyces sp. DSM 40473]MDT0448579.1 DUF317 domain-containing protein [Streptomyces sp. DSM 40473]
MAAPALTVGCFLYDTTRALFDGTVSADGVDVTMKTAATLPELFDRLIRGEELDVAELGLTFYLRLLETGLPFVALPVFPNRVFRHSCIFVNAHSGITEPSDLAGRTIGEFGVYGQDSGVWAKGIIIVETLLNSLAAGEAWSPATGASEMEQTVADATRPLEDTAWPQKAEGRCLQWTPSSGDPVGVQFNAFAAQRHADGPLDTWTMWGGNTSNRPIWAIHLSAHAPASLLQDLTFELANGQSTRPAPNIQPQQPRLSALTSHPLPPFTAASRPARKR